MPLGVFLILLAVLVDGFHILIPFVGQQVFLFIIALLTGGNQVPLTAGASSGNRREMIHGQLLRLELPTAIMTDAAGKLLLPPATFAKLPRLVALLADNAFIDAVKIKTRHPTISPSS